MKIKKVFCLFLLINLFIVITTSSILSSAPNLAAHFNSNGDLINQWYWLRDTSLQHYAQWIFERIPVGDFDLILDITSLATDRPSGGRGFPARFLLTYETVGGRLLVTQEVNLPNTSPSSDPLGYTCHGQVTIPRVVVQEATVILVRIERISSEDNHIAFRDESMVIMRGGDVVSETSWTETNFPSGNWLPETENQQDLILLPPQIYQGSLGELKTDGSRDKEDWYGLEVQAGQIINLQLTQPTGSSFSLYLRKPDSSTSVGQTTTQGNIKSLRYIADTDGIWMIRIVRSSGTGNYQLSIEVENQNDADSFQDAANVYDSAFYLYPGEYTGFLKSADNVDWYKIYLQEGQIIKLKLEMPSDASFGLSLSRPGSTSSVVSGQKEGNIRTLQYEAKVSGEWGIKISRSSGEGDYKLIIEVGGEPFGQSDQTQIHTSRGYRASKFYSNGSLIQGWYWLRDSSLNHYAEWTFNNIPAGSSDLVLDITALATDSINGGGGFDTNFLLIYGFPGAGNMGGVFQTKEITLPNVSPAHDPVGYTCKGLINIPRNFIAGATTFFFRIERINSEDNHIAFNQDSIILFTTDQQSENLRK
ncbi:MAG: hypothetical protein Kow00103_11820 [Candidatus Caldatribacteriota bacterium]